MIGKYVWFERIIENGEDWVNCRCDICGHTTKFSLVAYTGPSVYLACWKCKDLIDLEEALRVVDYASNEVFLK